MRRCLHAFFVGILTLSVVAAPAHACWRSRQARRYRPVRVVHACPPPVWSASCDPCGEAIAEVVDVSDVALCCPASPVAVASCEETEETVVVAESHGGSADSVGWGHEEIVSSVQSRPATSVAPPAEPTLAAESPAEPSLEPITAPLALEPAGGVTTASNEQPAEPPVAATPAAPAAASVLTAPAFEKDMLPEGDASADSPAAPPQPVEPKAADQAVEPAPVAEEQPAPPAPSEPEEVNIFEELDAGKAVAPAADEMPEEPAAVDPFAGEPAEPAAPVDEAAEPSAAEPARAEDAPPLADEAAEAAGGEQEPSLADEEMTEDEAAVADSESSADEAARSAEPAGQQDDGASEPAAADPFAAAEPSRRWIDATGTGSIVATLVSVVPDDHCVLETRGRRVVVPLDNLSRHDRDYVIRAGARLATEGETAAAASPTAADTAGL